MSRATVEAAKEAYRIAPAGQRERRARAMRRAVAEALREDVKRARAIQKQEEKRA